MALPTAVNGQITDAVTQSSVGVLGMAPAVSVSTVYQAMAHSIGIMMENNTQAQKLGTICGQAAVNMGVVHLYSSPTMVAATGAAKVAQSNTADNMSALLAALAAAKK